MTGQGARRPQNQLRQASAQSSSFRKAQAHWQPAQNSRPSIVVVPSPSRSRPTWQVSQEKRENVLAVQPSSLFHSGSGSAVSKRKQKKNELSKTRTRPVGQGTPSASKDPSGSSAAHGPSSQSRPSRPPAPASHRRRGSSPKVSKLFVEGGPMQMRTSGRGTARRVRLHSSRPSEVQMSQRKQFQTNVGFQESYKPTSHVRYSQSLPSSTNWRSTSGSSRKSAQSPASGTSGLRYAQTEVQMIPARFGGFAIRRLKSSEERTRKPQQTPPSRHRVSSKRTSSQRAA